MTRDDIKSIFNEAAKVEKALGGLPHRDAKPALQAVQGILDIVGEELPGGYGGTCMGCEEVKGLDEMVSCGDEDFCRTCADQMAKEFAAEQPPQNDKAAGT